MSREDDGAAGTPPLLPKLEGRIVGCMDIDLVETPFWSSEPRRTGLISGCLACIVTLPRRPASVRLRATLEICRFWSWFLWMTVIACDPEG